MSNFFCDNIVLLLVSVLYYYVYKANVVMRVVSDGHTTVLEKNKCKYVSSYESRPFTMLPFI